MYTLTVNLGIVTRDSDGKQIAPCQSVGDADFIAYQEWVSLGNVPNEITVEEPVQESP